MNEIEVAFFFLLWRIKNVCLFQLTPKLEPVQFLAHTNHPSHLPRNDPLDPHTEFRVLSETKVACLYFNYRISKKCRRLFKHNVISKLSK